MLRILVLMESQKLSRLVMKCLSDKCRLVFAKTAEEAEALIAGSEFKAIIADVGSSAFVEMLADKETVSVPLVVVSSKRFSRTSANVIKMWAKTFGAAHYLDVDDFQNDCSVLLEAVRECAMR